ncbi:MAG: hypothetical protein IJQ68_06880, partial [Methanobrevibacter sp.]|uniref:hypothetical protein n=1 Tax=Methanobrevibacter sp. TaxID=66852 RepID=UPI0025E24EFE
MDKRKIMSISLILFIFFISLCLVCASDVNDTVLSSDNSQSILKESVGTYSELQDLINSGNATISLDKDYAYNSSDSISYIRISNPVTINGNGHSIDGNNLVRH